MAYVICAGAMFAGLLGMVATLNPAPMMIGLMVGFAGMAIAAELE